MSGHTKGPWKAVENGFWKQGVQAGRGKWIVYKAGTEGMKQTEIEANARLIAAAPDLLEALEELSAVYSDALRDEFNITECPLIDKAHAAIARAKGESN